MGFSSYRGEKLEEQVSKLEERVEALENQLSEEKVKRESLEEDVQSMRRMISRLDQEGLMRRPCI